MKSMTLAVDKNGGIGHIGGLPWPRIAEDMAWFKHVTMQHKRCIMGRKTWESIGKLEGRECHVVTGLPVYGADSVWFIPPLLEDGDIVIGGASLYEHYADQVDVVFLTEVNGEYDADVKVDLEHLLKGKLLRGYVFIEGGHVLSVYVKNWTTVDDFTKIVKCASKAAGVLQDFKSLTGHQIGTFSDNHKELESAVSNPSHYTQGGIETIDAVGAVTTGYTGESAFCAGNLVKYIARAPFKGNRAEDLQKALWYLKRLIDGGGDDC